MQNIAVFASGTGSNAKKILEYFKESATVKVALVVTNKSDAGVLQVAKDYDVPAVVINRQQLQDEDYVQPLLQEYNISFIVLAGFLLLIPAYLIALYKNRIVNIHPALLPKYGGKGMYGMNVHQAVRDNNEQETGITIHYATEHYDEGNIIFQKSVAVNDNDTPITIAQKVQALEHKYYSKVIEQLLGK